MHITAATSFTNENGKDIGLSARAEGNQVVIRASSPGSRLKHTWTRMEAEQLHAILGAVLQSNRITNDTR